MYEIQVSGEAQGLGIGAHLLSAAESMAKGVGIDCLMLTVFDHNPQVKANTL